MPGHVQIYIVLAGGGNLNNQTITVEDLYSFQKRVKYVDMIQFILIDLPFPESMFVDQKFKFTEFSNVVIKKYFDMFFGKVSQISVPLGNILQKLLCVVIQ